MQRVNIILSIVSSVIPIGQDQQSPRFQVTRNSANRICIADQKRKREKETRALFYQRAACDSSYRGIKLAIAYPRRVPSKSSPGRFCVVTIRRRDPCLPETSNRENIRTCSSLSQRTAILLRRFLIDGLRESRVGAGLLKLVRLASKWFSNKYS